MSGSPIVLAVCSSWNMRSQVVHLALSMSKAVCQTRFEQTEYILHAVYEPAAHGLVPLRSARVPGLAATSFYPTFRQLVSIVWLVLSLKSYAIDRDDFQQNQVGGLQPDMLNVRDQQISTSGSGVWNISLYILLVLDNARLPPFHHTFTRIASSLISNRILKLEFYSIGKDLIGR